MELCYTFSLACLSDTAFSVVQNLYKPHYAIEFSLPSILPDYRFLYSTFSIHSVLRSTLGFFTLIYNTLARLLLFPVLYQTLRFYHGSTTTSSANPAARNQFHSMGNT
jgi:hypothetical protein